MRRKLYVSTLITITLSLLLRCLAQTHENDLEWSTFLGGMGFDECYGIALDDSGCVYVAGFTYSDDFPTCPGAFDTTRNGGADVFVVKLNPNRGSLVYATFLGGSENDKCRDIVVDDFGNVYVAGFTESADFPATAGAFDITHNDSSDVFVAKIDRSGGTLIYATFVGGSNYEWAYAIAIDNSGAVYSTGYTGSENFPVPEEAVDPTFNGLHDAFVIKLDPTGSTLDYATFLGGSQGERGRGIALDDSGNAYVTGFTSSPDFPTTVGGHDTLYHSSYDAFVAKLDIDESVIVYATFLGGEDDDGGYSIAIDHYENVYVVGYTHSADFPSTPGAFDSTYNGQYDAFVAKFDVSGSELVYATFIGGTWDERGRAIAVDDSGRSYVTGETSSPDFPTTHGAFNSVCNGYSDAYVVKLDSWGTALTYSTYLGGSSPDEGRGLVPDGSGDVYVVGHTYSTDFPMASIAYDSTHNGHEDVFVIKLTLTDNSSVPAIPSDVCPTFYDLGQNRPNPFNQTTQIDYILPKDGDVKVTISNIFGQKIATVVDEKQEAGLQRITWDASSFASGVYLYHIQTGEYGMTKRMILLR